MIRASKWASDETCLHNFWNVQVSRNSLPGDIGGVSGRGAADCCKALLYSDKGPETSTKSQGHGLDTMFPMNLLKPSSSRKLSGTNSTSSTSARILPLPLVLLITASPGRACVSSVSPPPREENSILSVRVNVAESYLSLTPWD